MRDRRPQVSGQSIRPKKPRPKRPIDVPWAMGAARGAFYVVMGGVLLFFLYKSLSGLSPDRIAKRMQQQRQAASAPSHPIQPASRPASAP